MGFWFWILCAILIFTGFCIARRWHDYAVLFTIAIGFAVNANIFNGATAPISVGGFVFSVDSILYTGFMFAIIICAHEYGFKKARILTYTSIAAILVSAVIEIMANVSAFGYQPQFLYAFLSYLFSAVGTFLGVWFMLAVYKILEKKKVNEYLNFLVCILIASVINTTIYYMGTILVTGQLLENMSAILLGSYIGKIICIALCQIVFFINTHFWIPNALKGKYEKRYKKQLEEQIEQQMQNDTASQNEKVETKHSKEPEIEKREKQSDIDK